MAKNVSVKLRNWKGKQVKAAARKQGAAGLFKAAEYALEQANRTVPIEDGTLEASGSTAVDAASLTAVVGYDTPYAVVQHEAMDYRHDSGRRPKWLELTMTEEEQQLVQVIGEALKGAF